MDNFLRDRGAIDAAFIFKNEAELDQSLAFLVRAATAKQAGGSAFISSYRCG